MESQQNEPLTFASLAFALANDYTCLYVVDSENDSYVKYAESGTAKELAIVSRGDDFFQDVRRNCREQVWPEDQEHFLDAFQRESVMQSLKNGSSFSLSYRINIGGEPRYSLLKTIRQIDRNIIIGVKDIDEHKRRSLAAEEKNKAYSEIAEALASRYEVIYYIDSDTNEYTQYSASDKYAKLTIGKTGNDFFEEAQLNMQNAVYPDDLPVLTLSMQKDNLLNSLSTFGKAILNYRLIIDGAPQYVSLYAVRPKEDSEHIIVAIANVDAAKRMELAYQSAVDMANKDALTGVKNKRAYVQAEVELDELIKQDEIQEFAIVICDVNGLKQVNDQQGHKAGDDFIRRACSIICNIFKHSPVFRIGGDEFAVILKGQDYANRTTLRKQLDQVLNEHKHNGVVLLASGISEFARHKDMHVQDVFERADMLMYEDKAICKAAAANH